jgi:hypothetical protein
MMEASAMAVGRDGRPALGFGDGVVAWIDQQTDRWESLDAGRGTPGVNSLPGVVSISWIGSERLFAYLDGGVPVLIDTREKTAAPLPDKRAFRNVYVAANGAHAFFPWSESEAAEVVDLPIGRPAAILPEPPTATRYVGAMSDEFAAMSRGNSTVWLWDWQRRRTPSSWTSKAGRNALAIQAVPGTNIFIVAWETGSLEAIVPRGDGGASSLATLAIDSERVALAATHPDRIMSIDPDGKFIALVAYPFAEEVSATELTVIRLDRWLNGQRTKPREDG